MVHKINNGDEDPTPKKSYGFLKIAFALGLCSGILRETDPHVATILILFCGYFLIRSD